MMHSEKNMIAMPVATQVATEVATTTPSYNIVVDLQLASTEFIHHDFQLPKFQQIEAWIAVVLDSVAREKNTEVTIRVVDVDEMTMLNETYRKKTGPTNVLSFPYIPFTTTPKIVMELPLLGDIVVCATVIRQESEQQGKKYLNHWAHMVVHGMLHLLNFDHITNQQAQEMELLEIKILDRLNISNPYGET